MPARFTPRVGSSPHPCTNLKKAFTTTKKIQSTSCGLVSAKLRLGSKLRKQSCPPSLLDHEKDSFASLITAAGPYGVKPWMSQSTTRYPPPGVPGSLSFTATPKERRDRSPPSGPGSIGPWQPLRSEILESSSYEFGGSKSVGDQPSTYY